MKKLLMLAAMLVAYASMCQAQLLWKVSGGGLEKPSYIFGTHHFAPQGLLDSIPGFDDAVRASDVVIGEIDMIHLDPMAAQQAAMKHAMAPVDSTLSKLLSQPQLDSLTLVLSKYSNGMLSAPALEPMKPAMVSLTLTQLQSANIAPDSRYSQGIQLDTYIQQLGDSLQKEVRGLETMDQQFGMLLDYSLALQAEQLMQAVRTDDKSMEMMDKLTDAYLTQDLPTIEKMFQDPEVLDEFSRARLIDARNNAWVAELVQLMPQKSVFVAVGAGHLVQPVGLLQQLRDRGFTVAPVQ